MHVRCTYIARGIKRQKPPKNYSHSPTYSITHKSIVDFEFKYSYLGKISDRQFEAPYGAREKSLFDFKPGHCSMFSLYFLNPTLGDISHIP